MKQDTWLPTAKVGAPHGLKGAFFLVAHDRKNAKPESRDLLLSPNESGAEHSASRQVRLRRSYLAGQRRVVEVSGVNSREDVEAIRGWQVFVPRSQLSVAEDEVLVYDLVGSIVESPRGNLRGKVVAVHNFGAQEILEVDPGEESATVLFPFVKQFIEHHDLARKKIVVSHFDEFVR